MVLFVRDMEFAKSVLLSKKNAFPKITIGSAQIVSIEPVWHVYAAELFDVTDSWRR